MALKLFTDTQKGALAKEAGVFNASADSFNRDIDPATGEATMYMKLGNNQKFYGASPTKVQTSDPVISQAMRMQDQNKAQQLYNAYNLTQSVTPMSKAMIQNDINVKYNYQDQFEAITQQRSELLKSMAGDQSSVFSAVNPDGTPVDPRVKVAQYQANMKSIGDRLSQLDNLEQTYRSEAKVLGEAEYNRQIQENDKAKSALLYLKEISDQEQQAKDNAFKQQQLAQQQYQFDANINQENRQFEDTKALQYAQLGKPELKQNDQGEWEWVAPPVSGGKGMRTDRHNNPAAFTTDIAKQAGLKEGVDYAVGDPFSGGKYKTARILGDPVETTIRVIDKIGFKTQGGASRWSYTDKLGLTNEKWAKMDTVQKTEAIKKMYKEEGGSGAIFSGNKGAVTPSGVQGKVAKKDEMSYEDALKEFGKQAAANKSTDIAGIVDSIAANYPTKDKEQIMKDFGNVATPELKKAIEDEQVNKEANLLKENLADISDDKATTDLVNHLKEKLGTNESVFKVFVDAGFFEKYKSGFFNDDSQYDAIQEFVENNDYNMKASIKAGKLTK